MHGDEGPLKLKLNITEQISFFGPEVMLCRIGIACM